MGKRIALSAISLVLILLQAVPAMAHGASTQTEKPLPDAKVATLETDKGTIAIQLFDDAAPNTVKNFEQLATSGLYNGVRFHRIIPGFMIQTGDPLSKDTDPRNDGTGGPGYTFADEITDLSNIRGAVAMANRGPDTNGSQFFINQVDNAHLDGGYTVFGQVYEGMDVVDAIAQVATDDTDHPLTPITLTSATVTTAGEATITPTEIEEPRREGSLWKTVFKVLLIAIGVLGLVLVVMVILYKRTMPKQRQLNLPKKDRPKRHKRYGVNK